MKSSLSRKVCINEIFLFFLITLIVFSKQVYALSSTANGWNSSGGETIKDGRNPWFFSNTKTVKYCLLVDEALFGQKLDQIRPRVAKAFKIWKEQLKDLSYRNEYDLAKEAFQLGTQSFIETQCDFENGKIKKSNVDLVLQFGVLTSEQVSYLKDPTQFLGVTVRTSYDKVNLRGAGFIYFSPERGSLSYNKLGLIKSPWSSAQGGLLLPAILHELGHLFGIKHTSLIRLMKETFIEELMIAQDFHLRERWIIEMELNDWWSKYLSFKWEPKPWSQIIKCKDYGSELKPNEMLFSQYFGINPKYNGANIHTCFYLEKSFNDYILKVVSASSGENEKIIGTARLSRISESDQSLFPLIETWLPKEQKVFSSEVIKNRRTEVPFSIASFQMETLFKGNYVLTSDGVSRPLLLTTYSVEGKVRFGGLLDGTYFVDLEHGY